MQSIPTVEKQPYEEFFMGADFVDVLDTDEVLVLASSSVTAIDTSDSSDVTDTLLQTATKVLDASEDGGTDNVLKIRVQAGATSNKYKVTFKTVTDLGNKWEKDIYLKVKEL